MFSSGTPRGALWLAGGILATILGAVADRVFDDRVVAVTISVGFAIAFGAATDRMIAALNRRIDAPASPPTPETPADDVHAGDHTG